MIVDLAKWPIHLRRGEGFVDHLSSCDLFLDEDMVWPAEQLVWLPLRYQCKACHRALAMNHPGHHAPDVDYTTCDTHSATPLMLIAIECLVLALDRLHASALTYPHSVRGCYHRVTLLGEGPAIQRCWCGSMWVDSKGMLDGAECRTAEESTLRARYEAEIAAVNAGRGAP